MAVILSTGNGKHPHKDEKENSGCWSEDIIGGNTALFYLSHIEDVIYPAALLRRVGKQAKRGLYPLYSLEDHPALRERLREAVESHLHELAYGKTGFLKTDLYYLVLGMVIMGVGAEIDEKLRQLILEAGWFDSWARSNKRREGVISAFVEEMSHHSGGSYWYQSCDIWSRIHQRIKKNEVCYERE